MSPRKKPSPQARPGNRNAAGPRAPDLGPRRPVCLRLPARVRAWLAARPEGQAGAIIALVRPHLAPRPLARAES